MSATIYIIIGTCGEYSDRSEWIVCWCATEAEATTYVDACRAEDRALEGDARDEARWGSGKPSMLDKYWQTSYTGTEYRVEAVERGVAPATTPPAGRADGEG